MMLIRVMQLSYSYNHAVYFFVHDHLLIIGAGAHNERGKGGL